MGWGRGGGYFVGNVRDSLDVWLKSQTVIFFLVPDRYVAWHVLHGILQGHTVTLHGLPVFVEVPNGLYSPGQLYGMTWPSWHFAKA